MGRIDQTEASVRSGGAGDAVHRQAFATRQSPLSGRPGGPRFQGLGTSSGTACDAQASRRGAIRAQGLENAAGIEGSFVFI